MICSNFIRKTAIVFLSIVLLAPSCKDERYKKETACFEKYLNQVFTTGIPSAKKVFLISPNTGCHGCRNSAITYMFSPGFSTTGIGIISQPDEELSALANKHSNIWLDEKGMIDKINLQTSTAVLIITSERKIKNIIQLVPENIDSIAIYCSQYH